METDSDVKRVVVGMHEALPDSIGNSHSMGDARAGAEGRSSGEETYKALENFRDHTYPDGSKKPVYVLASHSRYYMNNIFATDKLTDNQKSSPCRAGSWERPEPSVLRFQMVLQKPSSPMSTDISWARYLRVAQSIFLFTKCTSPISRDMFGSVIRMR